MSTDWNIPLTEPLSIPSLMETMRATFQELLNLTTPVQLYVDSVDKGVVSESLPPLLNDQSDALQVFYQSKSKENWETGVRIFAIIYPADHEGETDEFAAVVTMTGGGGSSRFRWVTAYGCAIALAREAHSVIDYSRDPEEVMEKLRCRQQHAKFEDAFEEVLANHKAWVESLS